jgi:regulator of sirC expression with transglutaminase-like and TPR domain
MKDNRSLVLLLYRSLLKAASRYDKSVPHNRNPFYSIGESYQLPFTAVSLKQTVISSFKSNKDVAEEKKVNSFINYGFENLRMLNTLYQPCLTWANIFNKKHSSLEEGAIAIAQLSDPQVDPTQITSQLDDISKRVQEVIPEIAREKQRSTEHEQGTNDNTDNVRTVIEALNKVIFSEMGFHGNKENYTQPENSLIHKVLARKTGIPASLCTLYQACAHRVGLILLPVGAPRHFLLKYSPPPGQQGDELFIDAFNGGKIMTREQAKEFIGVMTRSTDIKPQHLDAINNRSAYQRMLMNLVAHDGKNIKWRDNLFVVTHMSDA